MFQTTGLASPDSKPFNHSSCIAMGPRIERSFHISTQIGLNSYYYLTTRASELLRCCLQRSVLETLGRWEADMSSQRMSHTPRMKHSSTLCNILFTKAVVFVIDEPWLLLHWGFQLSVYVSFLWFLFFKETLTDLFTCCHHWWILKTCSVLCVASPWPPTAPQPLDAAVPLSRENEGPSFTDS